MPSFCFVFFFSFIIAVDYFQSQYPDLTIIFDMSLVYIVVSFFAVLANNILVEALPLNTRITFGKIAYKLNGHFYFFNIDFYLFKFVHFATGYLISFVTLVFVATCEVWWEAFGDRIYLSYFVNLVAVATVALGCTSKCRSIPSK